MPIVITLEPPEAFDRYAEVPIAFEVREVLEIDTPAGGPEGIRLTPRTVPTPYVKDYDADPANHPSRWPALFDVSRWGVLAAWDGDQRVGGAVVVWDSPDVSMLRGRPGTALLWDIRVAPDARGRGVGAALFRAAEARARERGARRLMVETQNVNVPACRFYARQGCTLGAIDRFAYPTLPDEAQLLWFKELGASSDA
jgi:ribosomal protein S18 acetylase RimI-like enzyme